MAKILIVDDSETLRVQLREALEEAGHVVVEGVDGADGLKVAAANPDIKMVITDFNMPQMDGVTMASKLREQPGFTKVPILMLTTEATPDIKAAGKSAGILAWIVKPLVPSKVMPAIEKVLNR
ncbi:MAG: response regulator [Proteobacteria bacterium]|nr:MAG: response regulator [Pseudomonadota bacterium]